MNDSEKATVSCTMLTIPIYLMMLMVALKRAVFIILNTVH